MCHYVAYYDHTNAVCGALLTAPSTTDELDPEQTTCHRCQQCAAWWIDAEALVTIRAIDAGCHDLPSLAVALHVRSSIAEDIIDRMIRCHQIVKNNNGQFDREAGK